MDGFGGFAAIPMLMQVFFFVLLLVVVGVIVFAIVKGAGQAAANNAAPEVSAVATVVDKRIETSGGGDMTVSQHHFVTFEQPGGERFELVAPAAEFGLLVVGDRGSVTMKGTQYLAFARELMR
jgi:outer membrane lipoprotein-sorting protein